MTAHTMKGLHNIVKELVCTHNMKLNDAIKILTINPANALGLKQKGILEEGKDADIIILDSNYDINYVIALGKVVISNKEILEKGMYE